MTNQIILESQTSIEDCIGKVKSGELKIVRVGSFLNLNYVTSEDGRVLITGREGTWELIGNSVLSFYFGSLIGERRGNGQRGLPVNIGEGNHLIQWDRRNSRLPLNGNLSRKLLLVGGVGGVEDVVTYSTRERWDYIDKIERGDVKILGHREFIGGEFLVTTVHHRMFYGRNGTLQYELDPFTLKEKPDEFLPNTVFVNFGGGQKYPVRGYNKQSSAQNKISLRNIEDVYNAMVDIANGKTNAHDYSPTNATKQFMDELNVIQKKYYHLGGDLALRYAIDYIIKNIDIQVTHTNSNGGKKGDLFINRICLQQPNTQTPINVMSSGKFCSIRYGERSSQVFDSGTALAYFLLGTIATFSYPRSR